MHNKDKRINKYQLDELSSLINNNEIHSPEITDSANECDESGRVYINCYDLPW